MGELLMKYLSGLLRSIFDGSGLDSLAQALLVGPMLAIRPVAIWIVSVNNGLPLTVLGRAALRGPEVQLSLDSAALEKLFVGTLLGMSSSDSFNRGSNDLPEGLNCGASKYSVLPVLELNLPKGFLFVSHQEHWSWEFFGDEYFEAITAVVLHAIEATERTRWKNQTGASVSSSLSERQITILQKMSTGLTNYQIGHFLNVSESTVKQECIRIFRFLNVPTRKKAVDKALQLGIIRPVEELVADSKEVESPTNPRTGFNLALHSKTQPSKDSSFRKAI